jgi:hypothetical protein
MDEDPDLFFRKEKIGGEVADLKGQVQDQFAIE